MNEWIKNDKSEPAIKVDSDDVIPTAMFSPDNPRDVWITHVIRVALKKVFIVIFKIAVTDKVVYIHTVNMYSVS